MKQIIKGFITTKDNTKIELGAYNVNSNNVEQIKTVVLQLCTRGDSVKKYMNINDDEEVEIRVYDKTYLIGLTYITYYEALRAFRDYELDICVTKLLSHITN